MTAIQASCAICVLAAMAVSACSSTSAPTGAAPPGPATQETATTRTIDAADFGFSPDLTGVENTKALQRAVDQGGKIVVNRPGTYKIAGTVFIGSSTSLVFGKNVFLEKVAEQGAFSHVLLNKGALTRTYDQHIAVEGLSLIVNGVDIRKFLVFGLHGQIAFFYVKDLRIDHFQCLDLGSLQYCIQICTFENVVVNDVVIKGNKDGVHLGRGKGFTISNGVFQTFDDAIALNGHDYDVGNPELGWIEDGLVENCRDLNADKTTGYFCRILAGAWVDWHSGMQVQKSDTVVSNGRLYRVRADPDGKKFKSITQPVHATGSQVLDGITWVMTQNDATHTAGVRNVTFRNISLEKPRTAFSIHFDNDKYSRSYYPGAPIPMQQNLTFDNVKVLYDAKRDFLSIGTPVDAVTISNSSLRNNRIDFLGKSALTDYQKTTINISGCEFNQKGPMELLSNSVKNREIELKTSSNSESSPDFSASVDPGPGKVTIESDLPGLKR